MSGATPYEGCKRPRRTGTPARRMCRFLISTCCVQAERRSAHQSHIMEIRSLCICDHVIGGFSRAAVSSAEERKTLPMLSVVQSLRGSYEVSLDGAPSVTTGDMGVFVAPGQVTQSLRHIPAADGTMDAHWVFLDVEIDRRCKMDDLYTFPTVLPSEHAREIAALIPRAAAEKTLANRLPYLHLLVAILLENATEKPHVNEDVARLRSYVENHYMHPITPDDIAAVLHCSRSAMYTRFRTHFDTSPSHYVNNVRIRHAQLLLTETDSPIGEIASAVGIPDVFYFARLFRSVTGETASEYRGKRR